MTDQENNLLMKLIEQLKSVDWLFWQPSMAIGNLPSHLYDEQSNMDDWRFWQKLLTNFLQLIQVLKIWHKEFTITLKLPHFCQGVQSLFI